MSWAIYERNKVTDSRFDHCDHLTAGEVASHVIGEDDSFGPVARLAMCNECYQTHLEEEEEVMESCRDCGVSYPMREINEWRWYDFHAPSGDEPRLVCNECWVKPEHVERIRRDAEGAGR